LAHLAPLAKDEAESLPDHIIAGLQRHHQALKASRSRSGARLWKCR